MLTVRVLITCTLGSSASGLEFVQPCQSLECRVLAAEDIGDGHCGHGSGEEGGVRCLIGEVVAGDVGAVTGKADDLDVDQSVLVDEIRQAESGGSARTHRGEQQIGLGQKAELPRSSTVLEVDGADLCPAVSPGSSRYSRLRGSPPGGSTLITRAPIECRRAAANGPGRLTASEITVFPASD